MLKPSVVEFQQKVGKLLNIKDYQATDIVADMNALHILVMMDNFKEHDYKPEELGQLVQDLVAVGVKPNYQYVAPAETESVSYDSDSDNDQKNPVDEMRPSTAIGTALHFVFFASYDLPNIALATALVRNGASLDAKIDLSKSADARINISAEQATPLQVWDKIIRHKEKCVSDPRMYGSLKDEISAERAQYTTVASDLGKQAAARKIQHAFKLYRAQKPAVVASQPAPVVEATVKPATL